MADHGFLSRIVADARKALPALRMQRPPSAVAEAPLVRPSGEAVVTRPQTVDAAPAAVSDVAAGAGSRDAPVVARPGARSARQEANATVEPAAPQSLRRVEARLAACVPYGRTPPPLPAAAPAADGSAAQAEGVGARAGQAPDASVDSSPARPGEGPPSGLAGSVAAAAHGAHGVPPPARSSGPATDRPQGNEVDSASGARRLPQGTAVPPVGSTLRMSRPDGAAHTALDARKRSDATPSAQANRQVALQRDASGAAPARERTPVAAAPAGVADLAATAPAPRPVPAARIVETPPPGPAAASVAVAPDMPTRAAPAAATPAPAPARIHIGRIDITVEAAPSPALRAPRDAAGPPADTSSRRYLRGL